MSHRTTFSLDDDTVESLRRLAALWGTSQAGVIRRAVRAAAEQAQLRLTPQQAIAALRAASPIAAEQLREMMSDSRRARHEADEARA